MLMQELVDAEVAKLRDVYNLGLGDSVKLTEPLGPVEYAEWPAWAKWVSALADVEDDGVGDTVARQLGVGGELFKVAIKAAGLSCGCDDRRVLWNTIYPYL